MSYLVLGCGAIGTAVAASLALNGHPVLVSDADPAVVQAVRNRGLQIGQRPAGGLVADGPPVRAVPVRSVPAQAAPVRSVPVQAVGPEALPERVGGPVVVAVRAHEVAAAAALLAGRLDETGYAVALSAGLSAVALAGTLGTGRVVAGQACSLVRPAGPGAARWAGPLALVLGELDGGAGSRVNTLAADLSDVGDTGVADLSGAGDAGVADLSGAGDAGVAGAGAGGGLIDARVSHDILGELRAGQARAAVVAAAALSGRPVAEALLDPAWEPLFAELSREVLTSAGARAQGGRAGAYRAGPPMAGLGVDEGGRWLAEGPAVLDGVRGPLVQRLVELMQSTGRGRRSLSLASVELLAAYERLERLGRPLNAVVAAAPVTDPPPGPAGSPPGSPPALAGPLAGRAVAVKDIIAVAGLPTRCGSPASDPGPAARDAVLVERLRAAGAEVLATTQCLEYAAGFAHADVGDTRNPRDPGRTSGGSSGGSAAVVAAGVCDLAIGTDTGGSIRIPAAYCGVVGFKPSYGLIPVDGVFPLSPSCDHAGTLTATVAGAAALFGVLAGPGGSGGADGSGGLGGSGGSLGGSGYSGGEVAAAEPGAPVLGLLAGQLTDPSVTEQVGDALRSAMDRLAAAGFQIRELTAPWLEQLRTWEDMLALIVAREAAGVHRGRDQSRYAAGTRALFRFGETVSDEQYAGALRRRAALTRAIDASLDGVAALAGPAVGYPAPEQDPPFGVPGAGSDHGEGRFTGPYNLSGHPAVSLPVPTAGLPAGLQLAGRRGGDRALLAVAAAVEHVLASDEP